MEDIMSTPSSHEPTMRNNSMKSLPCNNLFTTTRQAYEVESKSFGRAFGTRNTEWTDNNIRAGMHISAPTVQATLPAF
eukprot:4589585-Alexandrium_andersonii.AAC.1